MKRVISVILIVMLACNLWSWRILYKRTLFEIRKEQRMLLLSGIPHDQIEILTVPNELADKKHAPGFERVKDWEICYKGKMFDFFKEVRHNDSTAFYGITDHKENKLLAELKYALKHSGKAPLSKSLIPEYFRILLGIQYVIPARFGFQSPVAVEFVWMNVNTTLIEQTYQPEIPPPRISFGYIS